ncbi:MAG TPA: DNA-processing protein DprA [Thermoanaerobaculia bacterium]|nr:DNA-processing protein DprA [Thermoanaerobaculia bacterium]
MLNVSHVQAGQVKNPLTPEVRAIVDACRSTVVVLGDPDYPPLLREIIDPPLVLHTRGDRSLLASTAIAVVGSRRASPYGVNAASHIARQLLSAGLVIVSGLARGVDAAAHEAALEESGKTIAVLGTGIDVVYPRSNARLFRRIESAGLIVSEFAPGTPPFAENFPIRNRVISGLSLGTVIVEATSRSGSLITARMAAEQGREVFAVPGSIFSKGTEGTHRLIQYGAKLVHDVDDVLDELPGKWKRQSDVAAEPPAPLREVLGALTREDATHVDTLAARLSRTPSAVAQELLQLELGGWIRALPGSRYVRVR